jgi:predicted nucleotidyltransferase
VNELLGEAALVIPPVEFSEKKGAWVYAVVPEIRLLTGERSEKDRVVRLDAYSLVISFTVREENGERDCYAYAGAVDMALEEDETLGGVVDRAVLVRKTYTSPRIPHCGDSWKAELTLRVTVEGIGNRGR